MTAASTLAGKHLVITGFTGFLAKVYVAMLLEEVPDIAQITLLVRDRSRKQTAQHRVERAFETSPCFRPLRAKHGQALAGWLSERISVISADCEKPLCGLGNEALQQLSGADAVVHSAGLTDFQPDPLKAVAVNVGGASAAADLAIQLGIPLVHVSTCYVAGRADGRVEETLQPGKSPNGLPVNVPAELRGLRLACRRLAEDDLQARIEIGHERAERLGWPNIYTYSKGLAEHLLASRSSLDLTIVRPAIVECARTFPFPGWNEGINTAGPLAWLISTWFRHLPTKANHRFDIIPVDDVCRGMALITAAALRGEAGGAYQLASSGINPLRFGRTVELTGLAHRKWSRSESAPPIDRALLRHLDPIPTGSSEGPLPARRLRRISRTVSKFLGGVDREDLPGWLDELAGDGLDEWRTKAVSKLDRTASDLRRIDKMLALFKPFIHDHDWEFRADRTVALNDGGAFDLRLDQIDWRHYWVDVEYPGLRQWCIPILEGKKVAADPRSNPPLSLHPSAQQRQASK